MTLRKNSKDTNAKKVFLLTTILIFLITIGLIFSYNYSRFKTKLGSSLDPAIVKIKTQNGTLTLYVEIADNPVEHRIGLMNRTELDEDKGMLFVFKDEQIHNFWMKNTLIPLDIIFIDKDCIIKNIAKNTKPNQTEEIYSSSTPVQYVLEVSAGWCDRNGVELKDEVILPNGF